jgi:hypothetical protein
VSVEKSVNPVTSHLLDMSSVSVPFVATQFTRGQYLFIFVIDSLFCDKPRGPQGAADGSLVTKNSRKSMS